jgi:hypothetical protein
MLNTERTRLLVLGVIAVLFLLLRIPGTGLPLHQDEYKWPLIANPATAGGMSVPHPPLGEFFYREAGKVVGYDVHFRYVPLAFGFANLFLLWYWLRLRAGETAALWGAALFTLSYFSILASLMVDTDGQILPFFLLLLLLGYERARTDAGWWALVALAALGGFLVKASFVLAIGAVAADVLWTRREQLMTRAMLRYVGYALALGAILALALVISAKVFSFFDLAASIRYWSHFASFRHNWFQTAIQAVKAALYLSPLLVLMPLCATRQDLEKVRPLVFFTIFGLFFYLILFDFSVGALDRYLQFLIVPLVSLAAVILARMFPRLATVRPHAILAGSVLALGICALQLEPQAVPALYPKSAWLGRIASLRWEFLYPFSGGSGPLTFYVSFAFLGLTWIAAVFLVGAGLLRRAWLPIAIAMLVPLSLAYNATFTEEYLVGGINGFAPGLVERAAAFIANDPSIQRVVVYNDNGGAEVQATGKYEKRLYTTPDFGDWPLKAATMNAFKGHYLIVDAPPVDSQSFFARYFATCVPVYQDADRYMHATVLDCRQAPPVVL